MNGTANDLTIYCRHADQWWQPGSAMFRSLQNITPFRLELIRGWCGPIGGKAVIDLGCGGGLIAVPLIDEGALLTGVDISSESVGEAARASAGRGKFITADVRNVPLPSAIADVVLLADVLDHLQDYPAALAEAARLLKPGGLLFAGTINRTWLSWFLAICLGEGLRLIPRGTHAHELFITPDELRQRGAELGLLYRDVQGEAPIILQSLRTRTVHLRRSASCAVAYSMLFVKQ